MNDTSNIYLVAEGKTWDQALERRMAMAPLLDSLKSKGVIDGFSSATGFIAPKGEQKRRIDLWNAFWNEHKEEVLSTLDSRASRYGFSEEAFSSFRRLIAEDYSAKPFEHFDTLRQAVLGNSFSASGGNFSVVDVVKAQDIGKACQILGSSLGDRGYAFDFAGMNSSIARGLSDDFNYIGFACGLIVFIFLWLSFGRLELTLIAFLPMAMGWFWILGIMNMFGLQFNIVNIILATFIFGQGDDYTIFITEGLVFENKTGKPVLPQYKMEILLSALFMLIGIGVLVFAKHPAMHSLGSVILVGMAVVVVLASVLPPLLYKLFFPQLNESAKSS